MLGDILRHERERKELKQKEVAKMVNLAPSNYSLMENNKRKPDIDTLSALADVFGVTTDYLLDRTKIRNDVDKLINDANKANVERNLSESPAGWYILEAAKMLIDLFPSLAISLVEEGNINLSKSMVACQHFLKVFSGIRKQFESTDIETTAYLEAIGFMKNSGFDEPSQYGCIQLNHRAVSKCVDALYSFIGTYAADHCTLRNKGSFFDYADASKKRREL